ncbi:MAG: hypothetical protein D6731_15250 [Planctomycetota bacterium]|nr:MAG: hypothetical protein D6731_15250 [Planctomycetota bacterium]
MDRRLQVLERAFRADPRDGGRAADLAAAALRAGRPRLALTAARTLGPEAPLRTAAARRLAGRLHLTYLGVREGCDAFAAPLGVEFVLVPGGAFLDEGPCAWRSSVAPGSLRAPARPVAVGDLLVAVDAWPGLDRRALRERARALGGRLPTPAEWKKAWRGGLYLDGDASGLQPNPEPDRLAPGGSSAATPEALMRSPYGLLFRADHREASCVAQRVLCLDLEGGRYERPLVPGRPLVGRPVIELPSE